VLAGIRLYPVKALDPLLVSEARLAAGGALAGDRRFAMFDGEGKLVNGKRHPGVHGIRARFTPDAASVTVSAAAHPETGAREQTFALAGEDIAPLERWLSGHLGQPIRLGRNDETGFPDDLEACGPTLVSTASLAEVAAWFPELTVESVRRRFRANLEIDGVPPFWEDRLFGPRGTAVRFRVGAVALLGSNPCQRCAVPPRDPDTGAISPGFQKRFSDRRRETLPAWAEPSRFDHFYRFTLNTRPDPARGGEVLRIGDAIEVLADADPPAP
jgi:uncharacterized protein YcbX